LSANGKQSPRRPRIEIRQVATSPEEAAAIAAAIESFLHDTAPAPAPDGQALGPWLEAALLEGTGRHPEGGTPWGSPSSGGTAFG
jgi:hypothetical protein